MLRVKILKDNKHGKKGQIVVIDKNEAFGLIDSGVAEITKDMTSDDYRTSGDKNGNPTQLRSNKSK